MLLGEKYGHIILKPAQVKKQHFMYNSLKIIKKVFLPINNQTHIYYREANKHLKLNKSNIYS
jgi:hypothetical protein